MFNLKPPVIYTQIWPDRIRAINCHTGKVFDDSPWVAVKKHAKGNESIIAIGHDAESISDSGVELFNPFNHPRTIIADFVSAERLLVYIMHQIITNDWFSPRCKMLMHPMEPLEGGLTMIEQRALFELGASAGASDVLVYQGKELNLQGIGFDEIKDKFG